ncbi:RNA polymerase sigma factor [Carboxylicivirga sp. N1Y90]|uniref:RNA polymerase sigma factor n=1 Tax=Carboxylicivirga fragile TaxID=3417571 RepID=UPI003D33893D|nr:sigma-70 family RNA polymerase sigma factor [Marinilabiliaceae bacterium N1Y90]
MPGQLEFEKIYSEFYPKVFRLCAAHASGRDEWAKDAAQEVFICVWNKFDTLKDPKAISAWIYRIAFNTCMKRLKDKRKQAIPADTLPEISYSPEESKDAQEMLAKVYRALDYMKLEEKNLMLLLLEGIENEEVAEILGLSRANLRVRIHRTRDKLKKLLENERV